MKILRCWCSTPSGDKLFAINLPFTMKQYKVDNIDYFVYHGRTRTNKRTLNEPATIKGFVMALHSRFRKMMKQLTAIAQLTKTLKLD